MTSTQGELKTLGRYELLYLLGQGGMGEVHLARITGTAGFEKLCIVKTILPQVRSDPQFVERFHHEGRVLVQLNHSHIAQVYDMGEVDDTLFMAIEYVPGVDLGRVQDRLRATESEMPINVALFLGQQINEALGYAHRKVGADGAPLGLVHRDVSPQNVMVSYEGEVKVIDFGLAKSAARSKATLPSTVLGKLGYMSPEQAMARSVDHRGDIYSAGIVVWEMLAGRPLFEGGTVGEMVARMANPQIPSLSEVRPEISEAIDKVVLRALQTDVSARYNRADDFARALNEQMVREGQTISAEDVGNYVRAMCPEEFAAERKLQSRLSSLGRKKVAPAPSRTPSRPSMEGTRIRAAASGLSSPGAGDEAMTPAMRALSQLGPAQNVEVDEGLANDEGDAVDDTDPVRKPLPPRRPSRPSRPELAVADQQTSIRESYPSLVVPKSRAPMIVVGILALVLVGAGGVFLANGLAKPAGGGQSSIEERKPEPEKRPDPVVEKRPEPVPEKKVEPEKVAAKPDEPVEHAGVEKTEPVSLGRVEPKAVLMVIRDKGELWVKLGSEKATRGDSFTLVGEPVGAGSKQRDRFATGTVMEMNGPMARLVLNEGDIALPARLYAAKDSAPRSSPAVVARLKEPEHPPAKEPEHAAAKAPEKQPEKAPEKAPERVAERPPERAPEPRPVEKAPERPVQPPPREVKVAAATPPPTPPPAVPVVAVAKRQLTGNLNPSETGNLVLKNTTDFAWTQCELRIPPNRVYRFPASYTLQPRLTVMIIARHVLQDTRPPEAQVVRGAWALARCAEGTSYLAYDREQ